MWLAKAETYNNPAPGNATAGAGGWRQLARRRNVGCPELAAPMPHRTSQSRASARASASRTS